MGTKRRGSELYREAKKIKSNDSNSDDEGSSSSGMQTTPALPHQPVTDLADLPQATRRQFDYLLQALSDVSPETLYEVNILDQINAINSDSRNSPPRFAYKPPVMRITIGYDTHGDVTHDSKQKNWHKLVAHVTTNRYAAGYFRVEVGHTQRLIGSPVLAIPYNPNDVGVVFKERPWKEKYALKVQRLARKAVIAHNREVLGWWLRKIAHSETLYPRFRGRDEARREFLSGDVSWTQGSKLAVYFR